MGVEDQMNLNRLNLLTAIISLVASLVWFAIGQNAAGLIWLACSLVWLALAIGRVRRSVEEPHPMSRLIRRLSRMLLW
ncbi:MAG: hypothetical protein WAJ87_21195, partial [Bryobacteraceae bacterium]